MKLTKEMRKTFVSAIMKDVPSVDYREMASHAIQMHACSKFPQSVMAVFNNPDNRQFLNKTKEWFNHFGYIYFYGYEGLHLSAEVQDAVEELKRLAMVQESTRSELELKLYGIASSASTTQKLKFLLPEFVAYLPKEVEKPVAQPPAIINIVGDFLALGWKQPA